MYVGAFCWPVAAMIGWEKEEEVSDDHDCMCKKSFSRESWSWSLFFSPLRS